MDLSATSRLRNFPALTYLRNLDVVDHLAAAAGQLVRVRGVEHGVDLRLLAELLEEHAGQGRGAVHLQPRLDPLAVLLGGHAQPVEPEGIGAARVRPALQGERAREPRILELGLGPRLELAPRPAEQLLVQPVQGADALHAPLEVAAAELQPLGLGPLGEARPGQPLELGPEPVVDVGAARLVGLPRRVVAGVDGPAAPVGALDAERTARGQVQERGLVAAAVGEDLHALVEHGPDLRLVDELG
jgi:hypothetical protein